MALKYGRHFSADLYLCQNEVWKTPSVLEEKILQYSGGNSDPNCDLGIQVFEPSGIRISAQFSLGFVLLQILTENRYVAIDLFSWQPQMEVQSFSEAIINLFEPQVVSTESRIRAEHLMSSC